jgi:hypothetical protein
MLRNRSRCPTTVGRCYNFQSEQSQPSICSSPAMLSAKLL